MLLKIHVTTIKDGPRKVQKQDRDDITRLPYSERIVVNTKTERLLYICCCKIIP